MIQKIKNFWSQNIVMLVFYFPKYDSQKQEFGAWHVEFDSASNHYRIEVEGKVIHGSRIFFSSRLLHNFHYSQPLLTIGDCHTDDDFRGQGIYPEVIRKIALEHCQNRQVYILVDPKNIPSIRGIQKAGFVFQARLTCYRWLLFYFRKRLTINQE